MTEDGEITDDRTIQFLEKCVREFKRYAKAIDGMVKEKKGVEN